MLHSWKILIGAVVLSVSCTSSDEARPAAGSGGEAVLVPSFAVRVAGDTVHFTIRLANGGNGPAVLQFPTSQRYDFAVVTEAGDTLWLWSREKMFAQSVGTETIEAGREVRWDATWEGGGGAGVLRAGGRIVSSNHAIDLETEFEVPGR